MKRSLACSLFALFAAVSSLVAGEVYVPFASNQNLSGTTYRTKVWVTNTGNVVRSFSTAFIPTGVDGTTVEKLSAPISVAPNATVLLTGIAPDGKVGMLEVSGAPQLEVQARTEAFHGGTLVSSATVPVVAKNNALAPNAIAYLQGLERSNGGVLTDFAILNLSRTQTQCSIKAVRSDGSAIQQTVLLNLLPFSHRSFNEVLGTLGVSTVADAHFEVSCDQQFFAYANVYQVGGPEANFVTPSAGLLDDVVPGGGSGGGDTTGDVVFTVPGIFLTARDGKSYVYYDLPTTKGVQYKRAVIEFDMHIKDFPSLLFTGVTSFRRPNKSRDLRVLYYGIQIVNHNSKTTLDLGNEGLIVKTTGPWKANHDYHVRMTYDLSILQVKLEALENGVVTYTETGLAQHQDLSANASPLEVDFGQTGIADGAYAPPIGWIFSNLRAVLTPL